MITEPPSLDQYTLTCLREADLVVQHYRAFFALLDWNEIDQQDATRHKRGPRPHPRSAYIKAFLVGLCEGKPYRTQLRTFLVQHPWLVLELGFRPLTESQAALSSPYGFDVEATVPTARWLCEQLHRLDPGLLHDLFVQSVHALQQEIPGLGETVAFDVKHIYAWVRENNPNVYVKGRFDITHIPNGLFYIYSLPHPRHPQRLFVLPIGFEPHACIYLSGDLLRRPNPGNAAFDDARRLRAF